MKIYAPVKETNGVYASVRFVDGVGETDKPHLIDWFRNHGYTIEGDNEVTETVTNGTTIDDSGFVEINRFAEDEEVEMMGYSEREPKELDFESMSPGQLRLWMIANGYNVRNTRRKDKLLEMLRG